MTRNFENRASRQTGMAYFVRRLRGDRASADNREAIIAGGLALTDAENLCAGKFEAMRGTAAPPSFDLDQGPGPSIRRGRHARQLAFKF